jgi:hypothetical protein
MRKIIYAGILMAGIAIPQLSLAQVSMELEQACFMDIELTDYLVEVIESGSSGINVVNEEEASQIRRILDNEENANLTIAEKVGAVLTACSEGRILQTKNSDIINAQ